MFRILDADAIKTALPMLDCIDLMMATMSSVSDGAAELPLRAVMTIPGGDDRLGIMTGYLATPEALGVKLLCLFPDNPARGLSSHTGVVVLFHPATGQLRALLDAAAITALRTPAATAAASRILARKDAGDLAILGLGEQALGHLQSMAMVHPLRRVRVWGRDRAKTDAFVEHVRSSLAVPIEACTDVLQAVDGADLICTTTGSSEPILKGEWLAPGAHVNLVGASVQSSSEIDVAGVVRGRYFVDYRPSALAQAGELKRAIDAGAVTSDHIVGEIGEVFAGRLPGRASEQEVTLYKSLGLAAQDLAAASAIVEAAIRLNLGAEGRL